MIVKAILFLTLCPAVAYQLKCDSEGKYYSNGDTWTSDNGFYEFRCISGRYFWKTEITACILESDTRIPVGEKAIEETVEWSCDLQPNGSVKLNIRGLDPRNYISPQDLLLR